MIPPWQKDSLAISWQMTTHGPWSYVYLDAILCCSRGVWIYLSKVDAFSVITAFFSLPRVPRRLERFPLVGEIPDLVSSPVFFLGSLALDQFSALSSD
jgi:hypothetical protein